MQEPEPGFPSPAEYPSFLSVYVALAAGIKQPTVELARQGSAFVDLCNALDPPMRLHRYAPGKWSVQQVLGHVIDTERTFAYRALRIGRGDSSLNPPFDENEYAAAARHEDAPWAELIEEFDAVRRSSVLLFGHMPPEAWTRTGAVAGGVASVRALAYASIGHLEHHIRILRERYLATATSPVR